MQTWKKMSAPWPLSGDTCGCFVLNDFWLMLVVIVDGSRLEMYSSSSTHWQQASEGSALGHFEVIRKGWNWMLLLSDGYLLLLLSPFWKPLEMLRLFVRLVCAFCEGKQWQHFFLRQYVTAQDCMQCCAALFEATDFVWLTDKRDAWACVED